MDDGDGNGVRDLYKNFEFQKKKIFSFHQLHSACWSCGFFKDQYLSCESNEYLAN